MLFLNMINYILYIYIYIYIYIYNKYMVFYSDIFMRIFHFPNIILFKRFKFYSNII